MRVHQVASPASSARRDSTKPCQATSNGSTITGVCLNSGSPETGSTTGLTTAPTRASEANWPFQWIGTNTLPRAMPPLMRTRATTLPQREPTRASAPLAHAGQQRVVRMQVDERFGHVIGELGARPVRVMVCHWSRTRPVLRMRG